MSSWWPVLSLSQAGSCSAAAEATCDAATFAGDVTNITSAPLAAGTYFLWVDTVSGAGTGTFSLSASLTAGNVSGESCTGPALLTFSGGSASTSGSLTGRFNDASTSFCASTNFNGPDAVYSFTVTSTQNFTATLFPSGFRGSLALRGPSTTCSTASEYDCISASTTSASVSLPSTPLSPGTYYLWVDSPAGSSGTFSLTANLTSSTAAGDSCTNPIPLTFSGGTVSASGSTATATDDAFGSCGGGGPDRVYVLTVSGTRTIAASVSGSASHRPVIYVRSTCTSVSNLACNAATAIGGTASIFTTLTTGTYYLWVDSWGGTSSGNYTLSANLF